MMNIYRSHKPGENIQKQKELVACFHTRESNPALPRPLVVVLRGGNVTDTPVWKLILPN